MALFIITSCNSNPDTTSTRQNITVLSSEDNVITFDINNVEDIVYIPEDDYFEVIYNDEDVFDYENIAYITNRPITPYVSVEIDNNMLLDFIKDYNNKSNSSMYNIIEHKVSYSDNTTDIVYYLVKDKQ